MLVLHLISEQPRHGYEIIKAIEDLTGGAYAPSPGVVYPTLTLLEELGHVVSTADGTRKSFAITDAGSAVLAENKAEVETILARVAKAQTRQSAPAIIRAIENFRMSLRLKLGGEPLSPDAVKALASLLDETARKIVEI
jgi:DNA-binding PadR family transcriptional regulator